MGKHPNVKVGTKTRSCTKIETIINFSKFFSNIQTKKDIFFKIISTFALGCFPFTKFCIFSSNSKYYEPIFTRNTSKEAFMQAGLKGAFSL